MRLTGRDRRALVAGLRATRGAAGWVDCVFDADTIEWLVAEASAGMGDPRLGSQAREVARAALDVFRAYARGPALCDLRADELVEAAEGLAVAVRLLSDSASSDDPVLDLVRRYAARGFPVPASVGDRLLHRDAWGLAETAPRDILPLVLRDLLEVAADRLGDAGRRLAHDLLGCWDASRRWTSAQTALIEATILGPG